MKIITNGKVQDEYIGALFIYEPKYCCNGMKEGLHYQDPDDENKYNIGHIYVLEDKLCYINTSGFEYGSLGSINNCPFCGEKIEIVVK